MAAVLLPALLYLLNRALLIPAAPLPLSRFLAWYGNDILAGVLILGLVNLLLGLSGLPWRLARPSVIFGFLLLCGAAWEVLPLLYKPGAVFDWYDFAAYLAGGALYWLTAGRRGRRPLRTARRRFSVGAASRTPRREPRR